MTMFRKILAAVASLILVTGCADASVHVGGRGPGHLVKSTSGSFVGTPGVALAVTYDTSIGNGVGADGFASLPLRAGAFRYYVKSDTGSDANTCTQAKAAATPKATVKSAVACVVTGEGDQVLIAQGMSYPNGLANISDKGGFSPVYPLVFQSYDPADPTNEAKMGRATGAARPDVIVTGADMVGGFIQGAGTSQQYRVLRGLKLDAQNTGNASLNIFSMDTGTPDYFLFENDEIAQEQISFQSDPAHGYIKHVIFRNVSSHGQWGSNRSQGVYADTVDGLTIEDSAFWHNGWKEGANRTDSASLGGSSNQSHVIYVQDNSRNTVIRRNVLVDTAADGGIIKGGGIYLKNLSFRNPITVALGNGNDYVLDAPFGIYVDVSFNAAIGGGSITSGELNWGDHIAEGRPGSSVHHNVLARSGFSSTAYALMIDAPNETITDPSAHPTWSPAPVPFALPAYTDFYNNVSYLWNATGQSFAIGLSNTSDATLLHYTFTNNVSDDNASGSNVNWSAATFANNYTESTLLAALGYADETTALADWIAHPELHGWERGVPLVLGGYGVTTPALTDLNTDMRLTIGLPTNGQFIKSQDGSVLTGANFPTGVTLDSDARAWRYDGTGTTSSGTFSVTETPPTGPPHTTNIAWSLSPRPVLSSVSASPSSTTATATATTNTSGGKLFWEVTTSSAVTPDWPYIRAGLNGDLSNTAAAFGSQTVAASGAQSISSITGLTAGTAYNLYVAQLDSGNNPSLTSTATFTTTSSWTPASLGASLAWWAEPKPANLTKLGGGTPADGDQVSAITDLSGNSITLSQGTTGHYPVYHTDGTHYWLTFSGGQSLQSSSGFVAVTDGTGQHTSFATVKPSSATGVQSVLDADGGSNRTSQLLRTNSGTLETIAFNTGVTTFTDTGPSVGSGTVHVLSEKTSTTATEAFVDGTGNGSTAVSGTMVSGGSALAVGYNVNGGGQNFIGNWYGGFDDKGVMGSTDLTAAQTYMRALAP